MNKKGIIVITIGTILVLGGLVLVLYLFLFAEDPEEALQGLRDVFPFGDRSHVVNEPDPVRTPDDQTPASRGDEVLRNISEHPVAEGGAYAFVKDGKTYVRYISRGEGNLYEVDIDGGNHTLLLGNSNGLFSGAYRVYWADENNALVFSLGENVNQAKVATVTFSEDQDGFMWSGGQLPENTIAYATAPAGNSFFYTIRDGTGISGFTSGFGTVGTVSGKHVFSSPIREWLAEWPSANVITLTTKPSGYVDGHMYTLNPQNGSVSHALRGIKGLTTKTNKDASMTLYNESSRNGISLKLFNHREKTHEEFGNLKTLVDKCVWEGERVFVCAVPVTLPSSTYPDSWYQGKISFNDNRFEKTDVVTKKTEAFFVPKEVLAGFTDVDAFDLFFDDSGNYFFFTDRKTGLLWVYDITKNKGVF